MVHVTPIQLTYLLLYVKHRYALLAMIQMSDKLTDRRCEVQDAMASLSVTSHIIAVVHTLPWPLQHMQSPSCSSILVVSMIF